MAAMVLSKRQREATNARIRPFRNGMKLFKSKYETSKPNLTKALLTTGGGAAAGVVNAYMPKIAGMPTPLVVGSAFVAGALVLGNDAKAENDGYAYSLLCLGSGMLAVSAAEYMEKHIATRAIENAVANGSVNGMAIAQ